MSRGKQQGEDWWRRSRAQGRPPLSSMDGVDGGSTHGTARPSVHGSNLPWHNVHQSFLWNWKEGNWRNFFSFPHIFGCSNSTQKPLMTLRPFVILKLAGKRLWQKQSDEPNGFYDTGCYSLASIVNISLSLSSSYDVVSWIFATTIMFCSFSDFNDPSHAGLLTS